MRLVIVSLANTKRKQKRVLCKKNSNINSHLPFFCISSCATKFPPLKFSSISSCAISPFFFQLFTFHFAIYPNSNFYFLLPLPLYLVLFSLFHVPVPNFQIPNPRQGFAEQSRIQPRHEKRTLGWSSPNRNFVGLNHSQTWRNKVSPRVVLWRHTEVGKIPTYVWQNWCSQISSFNSEQTREQRKTMHLCGFSQAQPRWQCLSLLHTWQAKYHSLSRYTMDEPVVASIHQSTSGDVRNRRVRWRIAHEPVQCTSRFRRQRWQRFKWSSHPRLQP